MAAFHRRPFGVAAVLLGTGLAAGAGAQAAWQHASMAAMQAQAAQRDATVATVRHDAQRELNAMSARLAELQAQATRLDALGQRLVQTTGLSDGEFDFSGTPGAGGGGPVHDISPTAMTSALDTTQAQLRSSGDQLSVLESLLANRALDAHALPSRSPTASPIITSGFGERADPFGGGGQFHKGIDFAAHTGDPVYAVADGVVSFVGVRTGYGNVIEIDHGNGYVTRYAHNTALLKQVGDLVRRGTVVAHAGSTGRSTGAHVHLEVWKNGQYINPAPFLQAHGYAGNTTASTAHG